MSEPLRPYFWIRRNADTYVPLIPLDELPSWIALRGVSSTKNWEDICRGEMRFLGDHYDHNGDHFVVDIVSFTNATAGQDGGSGPGAPLFTPAKGASVGAPQTKTRAKDENANSSVDQIQV